MMLILIALNVEINLFDYITLHMFFDARNLI